LTAKVLKVINSAYYGLPSRVTTVSQAVTLLGLEKIKNLALAISLAEGLYRYSGLPFGRGALWQHSQACAVATQLISQAAGYSSPEEALIVGLLHDIAKALWTELFPERFLAALKAAQDEGWEPLAAEKEFLTVPHPLVGAWMLQRWQLPEIFQEAVRLHHQPLVKGLDPAVRLLSRALYLGNQMAKLLNLGEGGDHRLGPLPPELLQDLGLTRLQAASLLQELPQAFHRFVVELKLDGGQTARLAALADLLREREVVLLLEEEQPGPAALFFEAFAPRVRTQALSEEMAESPEPGVIFFWEGADPEKVMARGAQILAAVPTASLLLFSHRPRPPLASAGMHLWGPDWRLEPLAKGLDPVGRG
jgi:HD-like signal output (HDOD) protein